MDLQSGGEEDGTRDNFRGAQIIAATGAAFDAAQYSFFGDLSSDAADLGLDGALEDVLEVPLGELLEDDGMLEENDEEDLSLAALFSNTAAISVAQADRDADARIEAGMQQLLEDTSVATPAKARRPSSPSLRLTPGAPASALRASDLEGLSMQQGTSAAALYLSPMQPMQTTPLMHMLQPHQQLQTPPSGKVTGPTSVADLEAMMLNQASRPWPTEPQQQQQQQQHMASPMSPYIDPAILSAQLAPPRGTPMSMGATSPYLGSQLGQQLSPFPAGGIQQHGGTPPPPSFLPQPPPQPDVHLTTFPGQIQYPTITPAGSGPLHPHQSPHGGAGQQMQSLHLQQQHQPFPPGMRGPPPPPMHQSPQQQMRYPPAGTHGMSGPPRGPPPPRPQVPFQHQQPQHLNFQQQQLGYHRGPPPPPHGGPHYPPGAGGGGDLRGLPPGQLPNNSYSNHGGNNNHGGGNWQQQQQQQPQQMQMQHRQQGPGGNGGGGRLRGGRMMNPDEVEQIMHIMYSAVHAGHPYAEDYYFQAYVNAHCSGRNDAYFEPAVLRDLSEGVARLDPSLAVRFAPVEGLGKIVYSNVRTPRVLLDFGASTEAPAAGSGGGAGEGADGVAAAPARPLDQEPLLAARIMIEDCLNLLLDVDDIDRKFKAAMANAANQPSSGAAPLPEHATELMQRRALLLAGIASSFRLPQRPDGSATAGSEGVVLGDGIFRRVMALPKGRKLLARVLGVLAAPGKAGEAATPLNLELNPMQLMWAALRSGPWLFGTSVQQAPAAPGPGGAAEAAAAAAALSDSTASVASALIKAVGKMRDPAELAGCIEALAAGLLQVSSSANTAGGPVLPLCRVPRPGAIPVAAEPAEWLGDVVTCLVNKGQQPSAELASAAAAGESSDAQLLEAAEARRTAALSGICTALVKHLEFLKMVHEAASGAGNAEAVQMVATLLGKPVVEAAASAAAEEQQKQLRELLRCLGS